MNQRERELCQLGLWVLQMYSQHPRLEFASFMEEMGAEQISIGPGEDSEWSIDVGELAGEIHVITVKHSELEAEVTATKRYIGEITTKRVDERDFDES